MNYNFNKFLCDRYFLPFSAIPCNFLETGASTAVMYSNNTHRDSTSIGFMCQKQTIILVPIDFTPQCELFPQGCERRTISEFVETVVIIDWPFHSYRADRNQQTLSTC